MRKKRGGGGGGGGGANYQEIYRQRIITGNTSRSKISLVVFFLLTFFVRFKYAAFQCFVSNGLSTSTHSQSRTLPFWSQPFSNYRGQKKLKIFLCKIFRPNHVLKGFRHPFLFSSTDTKISILNLQITSMCLLFFL